MVLMMVTIGGSGWWLEVVVEIVKMVYGIGGGD